MWTDQEDKVTKSCCEKNKILKGTDIPKRKKMQPYSDNKENRMRLRCLVQTSFSSLLALASHFCTGQERDKHLEAQVSVLILPLLSLFDSSAGCFTAASPNSSKDNSSDWIHCEMKYWNHCYPKGGCINELTSLMAFPLVFLPCRQSISGRDNKILLLKSLSSHRSKLCTSGLNITNQVNW